MTKKKREQVFTVAEEEVIEQEIEEESEEVAEDAAVEEESEAIIEEVSKVFPGWEPIETAPQDGTRLLLSPDNERKTGELAIWRKTRGIFAEGNFNRWKVGGKWMNPVMNHDIKFTPLFWKKA